MATQYVVEERTLAERIGGIDRKFRRACAQIVLLNNEIEALQTRYNRAMKTNRRSFRYSIRLRLATLEGIRNMFYEYASRMADELEELQERVVEDHAISLERVVGAGGSGGGGPGVVGGGVGVVAAPGDNSSDYDDLIPGET